MLILNNCRMTLLGLAMTMCSLFSLHAAVLTGVDPTIFSVGTGKDISYLVIDESSLYATPLEFAYHYTYDSNNPLTGYDLLTNVASQSTLSVQTTFYGGGLGNSLVSFSYAGNTVAGSDAPDYSVGTYWSYYDAGGMEVGQPTNPSGTSWNYASVGIDSRHISPGSKDGWTLSSYADYGNITIDFPPSVAISSVPEPASLPLLLLSLLTLLFLIRCKSSAPKEII